MCGELVRCNPANIVRSPRNEALATLVPTSPGPYRGNGKRVDWLTETPFVRQQSSKGFYLCLVLFILSYP